MISLNEIFNNPFAKKVLEDILIPRSVSNNLKFKIRPYQEEAIKRFIYFNENNFEGKQIGPFHLLFQMATGSGKTLIMAGLILYLYKKGFRNILFFVNNNNILDKTKNNFINQYATKYLFKEKIYFRGKEILINEVENFEESNEENINIKFTTIQQLYIDLNDPKENSISLEDFKNKKICLLADEAHHLSSATKNNRDLFDTWEGAVIKILDTDINNILLEFTATIDFQNQEVFKKYNNKLIFKYDLAQFRIDKYSKEINLLYSLNDEDQRITIALILNLYRQELAAENNVNLKPVILFKAKKTIKESEQNKVNFHNLIDNLSSSKITSLENTSNIPILKKAFQFFNIKKISKNEIVKRLKFYFRYENCISANNDQETELNQNLLNSLEDSNNPIRAVFAVNKLNEGWDVLNLFDIVRLYEGQNTGGNNTKIGNTTVSEAQLIGRGARYFPFVLKNNNDQFIRKFDNDFNNDLRILEELYYHAKEDTRYISELKRALIETGIYDENFLIKKIKLKESFKKSLFYKTGKVALNSRIKKSYNKVKSFSDFGITKKNFVITLSSGAGNVSILFNEKNDFNSKLIIKEKDFQISNIPKNIIYYALAMNPFYNFDNLNMYFPSLKSLSEFIESKEFLGKLEITIKGDENRLTNIRNADFLFSINKLLIELEKEILSHVTEYEGSKFTTEYIHNVFSDNKLIKIEKQSERANGQQDFLNSKNWYVYDANFGTSEEKDFVKMFAKRFENLEIKYSDIYLIRNERDLKIYDKFGRGFEPDFILFCKQKKQEHLIYQVFIEPKGSHLILNDRWKEIFLKEIADISKIINIESDKYLITGVPFYNNENENEFKKTLEKVLK